MSKLDLVPDNIKPLADQIKGSKGDIDHLGRLVTDLTERVLKLEKDNLGATTALVRINGHTSKMPDYKAENTDHDARYATKRDLKGITPPVSAHNDLTGLQGGNSTERYHMTAAQSGTLHSAVTVADTGTIDMTLDTITGQQVSAETIGLTATISFVEGY